MSNFREFNRHAAFLLPPSVDEWLPQRHHFLSIVVRDGVLGVSPAMAGEVSPSHGDGGIMSNGTGASDPSVAYDATPPHLR